MTECYARGRLITTKQGTHASSSGHRFPPDGAGSLTSVREHVPIRPSWRRADLFSSSVQVVEPADEDQVRDLFDHFQRVCNAAGPERVPDAVDLVPDVTRDH